VQSILPELATASGLDWRKSFAEFSREEMTVFLTDAYTLVAKAILCRDKGQNIVTHRPPDSTARPASAENDGKPWDDPIPF
jgi:hypothetical protein